MTKAEYDSKVLSLKFTHDYNMLCFIRGQYIESLEAEIAELKAKAIVWHEYPEEKPGKTGYYIIHYTILNRVAFDFWQADKSQWDKYGEYISHWAYLPAPPKEVK